MFAGVRRHAKEPHVDFLRRVAVAVRLVKKSTAYRPLWGIVNRQVLSWAGRLAREDPSTCAAAAALKFRDVAWDQVYDLKRHEKLRRPQQNWPATFERAVAKLLGVNWAEDAQDAKAYERKVKAMTF